MSDQPTLDKSPDKKLGGPKTEEGRSISRLNAIKYGFFSQLGTEYDKIQHSDLCNDIYESFAPQTTYEAQLVEILLSNLLSYRRISFVEHELFKKHLNPTITRNILDDSENFVRVIQDGYKPQVEGDIIEELEKFQRYKTATTNLILKTQHELERLSRLRNGEMVPCPVVVDVNAASDPVRFEK